MSRISLLNRHVETVCNRLFDLYQSASTSSALLPDLLPIALKELGIVCEELQVALKELNQQTKKIADAQVEIQAERHRYQRLFELSPDGYLLLSDAGIIQEVNRATANLFNTPQTFLVGKSLLSLIAAKDRALLQTKLSELTQYPCVELSLSLNRYPADIFDASLTLMAVTDKEKEISICCLLRDITLQKRAVAALKQHSFDPCQNRSLYRFNRGEIIPLEPRTLWFIAQGTAKLTTLSERGEEILVGLAGELMVFGSTLTALPTYQATALSKIKLASIPLNEIAQSPQLAQTILVAVNQRLRQTESFLAIHGYIRVEERLRQLLLLLKQSFGEPVETGTRLSIRLTHQDLASACCTTRVTITRLFSKLQQQGKLSIDSQNHLILKDEIFQLEDE